MSEDSPGAIQRLLFEDMAPDADEIGTRAKLLIIVRTALFAAPIWIFIYLLITRVQRAYVGLLLAIVLVLISKYWTRFCENVYYMIRGWWV